MTQDIKAAEEAFRGMLNSVDDVSDSLLEAQKRFTGFAGQFAEMSSASNKHWTFISRILSGSGLWRVQNRVRALGNFFEILKMSEDKAIEGQKEAIKNFAKVQKNVKQYEILLKEIEKVKGNTKKINESELLAESDMFQFYKAQLGEKEAILKLEEQITNATQKNREVISNLSEKQTAWKVKAQRKIIGSYEEEIAKLDTINNQGLSWNKNQDQINQSMQRVEKITKNVATLHKNREKMAENLKKVQEENEKVEQRKLELKRLYNAEVDKQGKRTNIMTEEMLAYKKELENIDEGFLKRANKAFKAHHDLNRARQGVMVGEQKLADAKKKGADVIGQARQGAEKQTDLAKTLGKAFPGLQTMTKMTVGLGKFIRSENKSESLRKKGHKFAGFIETQVDKVKGMFKLFGKLLFAVIYWSIMFGLITAAVVGLWQAGFFDLIYNAYITIKDALIANKDVFIAVWTAITAFFGSLFALIQLSSDGTKQEMEAQKADAIQKFGNMVTAAITAFITLLVILLPVILEALVTIIPILIEALVIMLSFFFTELLPAVLIGIWEGIQAYFEQRYGEEADSWGEYLSLAAQDFKDWWMNEFYVGQVKTMVDVIMGIMLLRWGVLIAIQGANLITNAQSATGITAIAAPILGVILIAIGVMAIFIAFQKWLKTKTNVWAARIITAILAVLTFLGILMLLGISIAAWPIVLAAAIVGLVVLAWDYLSDKIADLFDFFAEGGTVVNDNMQIVGEKGPELVKLPVGSKVYPNEVFRLGTTNKQVNQNNLTFNISVNGRVGASDAEIRDIASKLGRHIEQEVMKHTRSLG